MKTPLSKPTARLASLAGGLIAGALAAGCGGQSAPSRANVDPAAAAQSALALCDANKDAAIDADEATAKCAPLAGAYAAYDADGDGKLTAKEVEDHITVAGSTLTGMNITVTWNRQPLGGAAVKLRPVEFFADALVPAKGTTDQQGVVRPKIPDEAMPSDYAGATLMYPGLYYVEITHPQNQLPARYNSATELGCEVNPTSREGVAVQFNLTGN